MFRSNEAVEVLGVDGQGDRAAEETVEQWEVDGEDGGGSVEGEVEAVDGAEGVGEGGGVFWAVAEGGAGACVGRVGQSWWVARIFAFAGRACRILPR